MDTKELWHVKCVLDACIRFDVDIHNIMKPDRSRHWGDPIYIKLLRIHDIYRKPENQLVAIHDCDVAKNNKLRIMYMKRMQMLESIHEETYIHEAQREQVKQILAKKEGN